MRYADAKLREEEIRAQKYLEPCSGSVQVVRIFYPFMIEDCFIGDQYNFGLKLKSHTLTFGAQYENVKDTCTIALNLQYFVFLQSTTTVLKLLNRI